MDKAGVSKTYKLGDPITSDIIVQLRNKEGRYEQFYCHSSILTKKSKFFVDQLCRPNSTNCIELSASVFDYEYLNKLLGMLYLSGESLPDSFDFVRIALGVLQTATPLRCEEISKICIQYLEAVPWEDKEEEEILNAVSGLGPLATPLLARIQPVDISDTKDVFLSAISFLMCTSRTSPQLDDLKTSMREQVDYMLVEDEDAPLVIVDDEVRAEMKIGISTIFSLFEKEMSSFPHEVAFRSEKAESKVLRILLDIEWMSSIVPKMDLMMEFISTWIDVSDNILRIIQDEKLDMIMWGLKRKLLEVVGKVLEAVSCGTLILPVPARVQLFTTWLPYIRKMKPLLESKGSEELGFPYKMADDLCHSTQSSIISMVLALPVQEQTDILADWIQADQVKFPDLSEALEVWCCRTKSTKRRLMVGFGEVGNAAFSL
ncbi:BTB/POZ domain-containing protein At3g05675-like [Papaver somniferum]|uniref:BTB/POZ domain-containing protein At3g05675-like n=1 Tax=Papaver somniferum TaxID=3469 RepID=UPI000E70356C|nr:BTB/POZ domain-containing protein At3g05675-like [Papaver somniferum]